MEFSSIPKDAVTLNNRGFAYQSKGDYDRAIADLNEAIRLDPKLALAYNRRGLAYHHMGDYDRKRLFSPTLL